MYECENNDYRFSIISLQWKEELKIVLSPTPIHTSAAGWRQTRLTIRWFHSFHVSHSVTRGRSEITWIVVSHQNAVNDMFSIHKKTISCVLNVPGMHNLEKWGVWTDMRTKHMVVTHQPHVQELNFLPPCTHQMVAPPPSMANMDDLHHNLAGNLLEQNPYMCMSDFCALTPITQHNSYFIWSFKQC